MAWHAGQAPPPSTMPWGKHRGQPFGSIPTDYLVWVLTRAEAAQPELKERVRAELRRRGVEVDGEEEAKEEPAQPPPPPRNSAGILVTLTNWYRRACKRYHPDRGGSDEQMRVINEAYEELRKLLGG